MSVLFFTGNAALLTFEIINPYFGWWHAFSLCTAMGASVVYGYILQYYSSRMVQDIFIKSSGKEYRVKFLNAFLKPREATFKILDNGHLSPS